MSHLYDHELAVAIRAVSQAARLCRGVASEISPEILAKKDTSPVTVADFGSQALICKTLAEAFPDDPVIAEEDAGELRLPENAALGEHLVEQVRSALGQAGTGSHVALDLAQVCAWIDRGGCGHYRERFWTLDPIDGTKGFLRGEQYAVALALIVKGRVVVAALACPNLALETASEPDDGETPLGAVFYAVAGEGAHVAPAQANLASPPAPERLTVSRRNHMADARFCESVESGHSAQGDSAALAARLGITERPVRMDSQAKYAVVARGEADIYLRLPTRAHYREKIWDHAAGALIVVEAGGMVTDIFGRELEFNHGRELTANRGVVVSNGLLHPPLVDTIRVLGIGLSGQD